MKRLGIYLLIALFVASSTEAWTNDGSGPSLIQLEFDEAKKNNPADSKLVNILQKKQVVFVGGFGGEMVIDKYFQDNVAAMTTELKMPAKQVHVYQGESLQSIEVNADLLYQNLKKLYAENGKKPIVAVGHSMGGNHLLYCLLKYPELITEGIVERAVSSQAPINGTKAASTIDDTIQAGGALFGMIGHFATASISQGLKSLRPDQAHLIFSSMTAQLKPEIRQKLSEHIFYVRSSSENIPLNQLGSWVFDTENDGTVLIEDQKLSDLGQDLGLLKNILHSDLFNPYYSKISADDRRAFTRALVGILYKIPAKTESRSFIRSDKVPKYGQRDLAQDHSGETEMLSLNHRPRFAGNLHPKDDPTPVPITQK